MPVSVRSRRLDRRPIRHDELAWRAEAMLESLGLAKSELSILLCDDATIQKLNRRYRNRNRATDVLAFAMREGPELAVAGRLQDRLLGDVVISVPTATRQARARGATIVDEVTFLLAHGLLHLVGYDHETDTEELEMRAETEALIDAVEAARVR